MRVCSVCMAACAPSNSLSLSHLDGLLDDVLVEDVGHHEHAGLLGLQVEVVVHGVRLGALALQDRESRQLNRHTSISMSAHGWRITETKAYGLAAQTDRAIRSM